MLLEPKHCTTENEASMTLSGKTLGSSGLICVCLCVCAITHTRLCVCVCRKNKARTFLFTSLAKSFSYKLVASL